MGEGVLQKGGGVLAGNTEALGEVALRLGDAFPVEIIVSLTHRIRQGAVRLSGNDPAAVIDGVGTGQFSIQVQTDGNLGFRLRVEAEDGLS